MQLSASVSSATSATPASAAAHAGAAKPASAGRVAFASLLQQSRSVQASSPETAVSGADPIAAAGDDAVDPPATPNTPFKPRLKPADKVVTVRPSERGCKAGDGTEPPHDTSAADPTDAAPTRRNDTSVADPALAPWLPTPPQSPRAEVATAPRLAGLEAADAPAGNGSAADAAVGTQIGDTSAHQAKTADASRAWLERSAASQEALSAWNGVAGADSAALQLSPQPAADDGSRLAPLTTDANASAAALGAAAFNPLPGAVRDSTAPLGVHLPTPLASPQFAQALGLQMSVLASDGVQRAELQLNPAEMGPVSVRIVIDGTSARVDFGADLAATRQAIEAGLPELAGALRDAGFTLTGGGVSQHSGRRSGSSDTPDDSGSANQRGARAGDSTAVQAAPQRRAIRAGGVDIYA